ncbi:DUF1365 domain-containing protein [Candidatus Uabimicrobium amorphum]|uniref:DUF1365 domain-containing protein n=1 Tax=Uabimicrobium amorphum TaxID=2596890 RepID=A0A5S9F814_UABAM|nr:DUF1365 domain-containing protein [Candidatus Uabimicrobium amorphum]BBM88234.1 DUF1365 domain-containing protein [Candidatus Uabimicrobium amorphum]
MQSSCIYEGQVVHNRVSPLKNKFTYNVYMMYVDLDEITSLAKEMWCIGLNKLRLFSFYEKDYLWCEKNGLPLKERFQKFLQHNGITKAHRVYLLTNMRIVGYVFNPVSFYFCFDENENLYHIVAEVTNTFSEQKYYHIPTQKKEGNVYRYRDVKDFYISPFVDSETNLKFFFQTPDEDLKACIHTLSDDKPIVKTALSLKKIAMNNRSLVRMFFKYPHMTWKVVFFIHYQAFRLWWKKVPFFTKKAIDNKMTNEQKAQIVKKQS